MSTIDTTNQQYAALSQSTALPQQESNSEREARLASQRELSKHWGHYGSGAEQL